MSASATGQAPRSTERPALTIGILGGGQLGLMLCQAARRLGLETLVVSPDAHAPALATADETIIAPFEDRAAADRLVRLADVVTYELEAIPGALLDRLAAAARAGDVHIRPSVEALQTIQDKGRQKAWMVDNDIPTLPFQLLPDSPGQARDAAMAFGLPLVQKVRRGGYDGQGVRVLREAVDLERLAAAPSLVEHCLDERTEIAVVVARGTDGTTRCYAPVEMTFDAQRNVLDTLVTPARIPPGLGAEARALARRVVTALEGIGVFAVEMFVKPDGVLVVNEISPRVHNAGHHTIEACAVSQFEQHLRAVAGLPLGDTDGERPATMRNLLYSDELEPLLALPPGPVPTDVAGVHVHWYGKREGRPGRKVGHVTCLTDEPDRARRDALAAIESIVARTSVTA